MSGSPSNTSYYRVALDQTIALIERRAAHFRNQIVTTIGIGAATILGAVIGHSLLALVPICLLIPINGLYFFGDGWLLNKWRKAVLANWMRRELDVFAFRHGMRAVPSLPSDTVESMLATLPRSDSLSAEQALSAVTRQAVAAEFLAFYSARVELTFVRATASLIVAGGICTAIWARSRTPLAGLVLAPVVVLAHRLITRSRDRSVAATLATCRAHPQFSEEDYTRLVAFSLQ